MNRRHKPWLRWWGFWASSLNHFLYLIIFIYFLSSRSPFLPVSCCLVPRLSNLVSSYATSTLTHLVNGPFFGIRQRQNGYSFETSILCFIILHVESYLHAKIPITTHSLGFEIVRCILWLTFNYNTTATKNMHMTKKEIGEISDFLTLSRELLGLFCRSIWVCLFAEDGTANQPLRWHDLSTQSIHEAITSFGFWRTGPSLLICWLLLSASWPLPLAAQAPRLHLLHPDQLKFISVGALNTNHRQSKWASTNNEALAVICK